MLNLNTTIQTSSPDLIEPEYESVKCADCLGLGMFLDESRKHPHALGKIPCDVCEGTGQVEVEIE